MNTINNLLAVGTTPDDTAFHAYIADLRNSIVEAAQIRLYSDDSELRLKCDSIIETMTATLNMLEGLEREFLSNLEKNV